MSGRLEKEEMPRRDFLSLAGLWTSGLAIFGSLLGMAKLPKPRVSPEASQVIRVGKTEDYPAGSVKDMPEKQVRIVSTEQGIAAMSLVCTHLGCIVEEAEGGFSCPCHGSKFNVEGKVTGGPAPRGLMWLAVGQAADGTLLVDRGKEVPGGQYFQA